MNICKVLIVEDDALSARYFADVVSIMGCTVCGVAATAGDAIDVALTHRPNVALMDVRLRGKRDGVDAARAIQLHVPLRVIYLTASTDRMTMERIMSDRPYRILTKPVLSMDLKQAISAAVN